jgi:hypothetical protein
LPLFPLTYLRFLTLVLHLHVRDSIVIGYLVPTLPVANRPPSGSSPPHVPQACPYPLQSYVEKATTTFFLPNSISAASLACFTALCDERHHR